MCDKHCQPNMVIGIPIPEPSHPISEALREQARRVLERLRQRRD